MKQLARHALMWAISLGVVACSYSQERPEKGQVVAKAEAPRARVGGPCEGCEAVLQYGDRKLSWQDTLPGYSEADAGPKLHLSGTIYQADGRTPAKDVILYVYHTDKTGEYTPEEGATGWARRHGRLRGWIKTDAKGRYAFYTTRPASYPNSRALQHIHATVKEPDKNEYYIDEYIFADDPFLKGAGNPHQHPRGGSGLLQVRRENGVEVAVRDIVLGKNIPDYQ